MTCGRLVHKHVPVTPEAIYSILARELPGRFPSDFPWGCRCEVAGFPGCSNLEHFCQRVFLAIVDYHQVEETKARGLWHHQGQEEVIRLEQAPPERRRLYGQDIETALELLRQLGVKLNKQ